jgi:parallel beta-helix repeat protein
MPDMRVLMEPAAYPVIKDSWAGIEVWDGGSLTMTMTTLRGAATGMKCRTDDVYVSECEIEVCGLGIKIEDAAPLVDNNVIRGNDYGISASDALPTIVGNVITENRYSGILMSNSSDAVVAGNEISLTSQGHGISCYSSDPSIVDWNRIESNSLSGIYLSNSSPLIDSCWIALNGECGIKAAYYSDPEVRRTSIVGNRVGLGAYVYADPVLGDTASGEGMRNDIRQNTDYAVYNVTANPIKAQMNWWGDSDPDPSLFTGPVDYSEWLVLPPAGIDDSEDILALIQGVAPNPFGNLVQLSLQVGHGDTPVDVRIYDARGRLVRRLGRVHLPGRTEIQWDGRDSYGSPVGSGTYFLSVTTKRASHSRKIILLR